MVVDVFLFTADNNGDIDMRDIVRVLPGSIEHGEYIIDILSIPGRTYKFLILKRFKTPIVTGMSKQGFAN